MITCDNLLKISWLLLLLFMAAGCTTSSYNTDLSGTLVVVYDDSPEEDYTKVFPIHEKHGVPGCIAVISETVGTENHLSVEQILEMQEAGWEIMAHGKLHAALRDIAVTQDVEPGSQEIHVYFPHFITPGYHYSIFRSGQDPYSDDVETRKVIVVKGENYRDGLIMLDEPLEGHYEKYQAAVWLSYESAIEEIAGCKRDLLKIGAAVSSYVFPYSAYADWSVGLVSRYYLAARDGTYRGDNGLNYFPLGQYDQYTLNSDNFEIGKLSRDEIVSTLKKAHDEGLLCIFHAHSWRDSLTKSRIEFVLETAKKIAVRVSTLRSALNLTSFQSVEEVMAQ